MIKAVVFDADGVLINGEIFSKLYARDFGIPPEEISPFFEREFQKCLIGKADIKKEILPYLKGWGWEKSVDEFLQYWFKAEHKIDEELISFIKLLKKQEIKCYVGTNQEKYRTEYIITHMGFGNVFDGIFSSAHLGHKKPDKEFFETLLKKLGEIKKDEIIFWDNTQAHINTVKKLGFHGEKYTNLSHFKHRMDHYLSKEKVDVVDKDGNTLYSTSKKEAHEKGLLHKTVIAEIINSKGEMMLIRPYSHKQDAGQYVSPVGGHVSAGETDEEALKREVKEEVGIQNFTYKIKGRSIFDRHILGRHENHYFIVYEAHTDEKPNLGDEAESYKYFSKEELRKDIKANRKNFGDAFLNLVDKMYPELKS